jgi:hypothetical protein
MREEANSLIVVYDREVNSLKFKSGSFNVNKFQGNSLTPLAGQLAHWHIG